MNDLNGQPSRPERVEGLYVPQTDVVPAGEPSLAPAHDVSADIPADAAGDAVADVMADMVAGWVPAADVYRVRVWSSRRWGVVGPWGWRAQVDHVSNWDQHGDAPLFAGSGRWHRRQGEAVDWAVEEAHLIHDGEGCGDCHRLGLTPGELPLMIQVGGVVVEDHRTDAPTGGDRR